MKWKLLTILLLMFWVGASSKNYYISSASGNDNNAGTLGSPWKTMYKVNVNRNLYTLGDSILFERGGTYMGQFSIANSGTLASPIVISAYGTGAKPIISGLVTLHTWTNISGNIWQCTPDSTLKTNCNVLTINGIPQAVGRTDWLVYQTATGSGVNGSLTSSSLTGSPNYTGAEVVLKCNAFVSEKCFVTSQATTTINFTTTGQQPINNGANTGLVAGRSGYGFFFQRFAGSLDVQGEWYFNKATNKMQIYSTTNPNSSVIKASYVDTLFLVSNKQNIIFNNISIEGAGLYGIESYSGTNVQIRNCYFINNTLPIYMWIAQDPFIYNNVLANNICTGILINGNSNGPSKRITIQDNTILNSGQFIGNGTFNIENSLRGIVVKTDVSTSANYISVLGNTIRNTGNGSLIWQGSNVTLRRNILDTMCNTLQDNGGIYSFVNTTSTNAIIYINRLIDSNFISHAIGSPQGEAGHIDVSGLYFDDQSLNVASIHNTIYKIPGNGMQINTPLNMVFYDNTVYDCDYMINLNRYNYGNITGNRITRNILYQKDTIQRNFFHINNNLKRPPAQTIAQSIANMAFMDSNWISNQFFSGYKYYYRDTATSPTYIFPPNLTLPQWQGSPYLHDVHSIYPGKAGSPMQQVVLTKTNSAIYVNPSYTPLVVFFSGLSKVDPKGNVYNNQVTVPAWSSLILINNGNATSTNKKPVANAGANQTITLPANSATLTGSGNDSDGVITAYLWTQISGPNTANINSPNSASTLVSGLISGIYQFQLTVTDNNAATGTSITKVTVNAAANQPPTTNAGADQTITLPTNSTTLTATANDVDGSIVLIQWTKISGGTGGTIGSPNSLSTLISNLQQGTYQYKIKVTDNAGDTAVDVVQIIVNPAVVPNNPPVVSAGSNQTITLPLDSVTLVGTATDSDGTIVSKLWTKISGGTGGTIVSPSSLTTKIRNLQQGIYQFQLAATDDDGATTTSVVTITVNAAIIPNSLPVANAGADSTLQLPKTTSTLIGFAVDADEEDSILTYHWTKISGPSGGTLTYPDSSSTPVTALQQGTYQYQLTATDTHGGQGTDLVQIIVQAAANVLPTANAGIDQSITLPTNSTTMAGSGTDPDGSIVSHTWTKISGPSGGTITTPSSFNTTITSLQQGTYQYQLQVVDNNGGTGIDVMQIIVNPAIPPVNDPPTANAGSNITRTLPTDTATLFGSGTDTDGTIVSYAWIKLGSSPSGGAITSPSSATTGITGLLQGSYTYQLTVTDNNGGTGTSLVVITVNPQPPNQNPTVSAGSDVQVTLPTNSTSLTATGNDVDGFIVSYQWIKISGPAGGTIVSPNSATTSITNLQVGTYQYQVTVTDNNGGQGTSLVQVIVNPAIVPNQIPIVDAGGDQTITLPTSTTTFTGTATDPDGSIVSQLWTKVSGPSGGNITSPTALTTGITALQIGTYQFQLAATDNSMGVGTDLIQVDVLPPVVVNQNPTAIPGANQTITLPTNTATLTGSGTDPDGTIISYAWTLVSGNAGGNITSPNSATTGITGLLQGVYTYQLLVTDNNGGTGVGLTTITVNAAPVLTPPVANAGNDTIITVPISSVTLTGSGTDGDGTIVTHVWTYFSGPGGSTITTPNNYTTSFTGLVQGTYLFKLTVTDNDGLIGTALVQITVLPSPILTPVLLRGYKFP